MHRSSLPQTRPAVSHTQEIIVVSTVFTVDPIRQRKPGKPRARKGTTQRWRICRLRVVFPAGSVLYLTTLTREPSNTGDDEGISILTMTLVRASGLRDGLRYLLDPSVSDDENFGTSDNLCSLESIYNRRSKSAECSARRNWRSDRESTPPGPRWSPRNRPRHESAAL